MPSTTAMERARYGWVGHTAVEPSHGAGAEAQGDAAGVAIAARYTTRWEEVLSVS